jgi:hypothetical protein
MFLLLKLSRRDIKRMVFKAGNKWEEKMRIGTTNTQELAFLKNQELALPLWSGDVRNIVMAKKSEQILCLVTLTETGR